MKIKFLLAYALVIAFVIPSTGINAQQKNEKQKNDGRTMLNVMSDGSGESLINYIEDGRRYKIKVNGSKIVEMFLDDKKVVEEDYPKYESTVKKILAQIEKDRKQAEKDRQQAEKDREQAEKDRMQAEKDRVQANEDRKQADKDREQAEQDRIQAGKDREQAEKDRAQAELDRKQAEEDRKLLAAMMDDVIKEKLVENKEALKSLKLDSDELVINGTKQPDNVHSKFKTKYLKGGQKQISYRNTGEFRGMSID